MCTATPLAAAGSGVVDESQPHSHTADGTSVMLPAVDPGSATGAAAAVDESQPHSHAADGTAVATTDTSVAATATWPRPWDPSKPIDVSGVPGVTPEQEARATKLIEDSLKDLPKYADTAAAVADGYSSIGDAGTGSEHYIKLSLIEDNDFLDPEKPESLVYTVNGDSSDPGGRDVHRQRPTDRRPEPARLCGPADAVAQPRQPVLGDRPRRQAPRRRHH